MVTNALKRSRVPLVGPRGLASKQNSPAGDVARIYLKVDSKGTLDPSDSIWIAGLLKCLEAFRRKGRLKRQGRDGQEARKFRSRTGLTNR
jgi:hypothetical protein